MNEESAFVKMYSADWCYDCKAILNFFEEKNVAYKVYHVDHDAQAVEQLMKLCDGKKIIPTLEIGNKVYINPSIEFIQDLVNPLNSSQI